ncbi:MAG: hypothetical protein A2Y04_02830 [Omnitrophica WOR_2 bacterium GWC2_45_7]|nr:MAG: hypothetical protein A2Y04_02830 [Omnitrophica WOR_2 bacterium GWC2_45_7]
MTQKIIFFTLLFCCVSFKSYGANETFPFVAEITENNVSVRAGQSINFEKICTLKKGDEVLVTDKQYSWYKIKLPQEAKSFVSEKYVVMKNDHEAEIVGDRVNVRAGAGIQYAVLGQLVVGSPVTILEKLDGWYRIKPVEESFGWISKEFVVFKSKDVKSYALAHEIVEQSSDEREKIEENPDGREETSKVEEPEKQVKVPRPVEESLSVSGILEQANETGSEYISYKLTMEGQSICYVKGLKPSLDRFLNYKVTLEGKKEENASSQYSYPVLVVSKIQIVL